MSTLTKAELATAITKKLGLNNRESKELVDVFFQTISEILISGKELKLSGFGNFILRDKKSRPGRNPKTGEKAIVSARRVVVFHGGQKMRSRVAQ
jgi:integration host factor subunit alpha